MVLRTEYQLRRSAALSSDACIVATCEPPSLDSFTFKSSSSFAYPFVKIFMDRLGVFKMFRAFSLLVLVANCVLWASAHLIPLQLPANASLTGSAFLVK